jgi:UDP-N-acetylmuramyl pentapeptide phosphotransferase/UDP-N-acetylglucosamine-1-phosphate transferase
MNHFMLSFVVSLLATFMTVRSSHRHGWLSADHDLSGPQKFHAVPVPRIGGIGLALAVVAAVVFDQFGRTDQLDALWFWVIAAIPAFAAGLAEDFTKRVSARRRLFFTAVSTLLGMFLLNATITRTGIPGMDELVSFFPFAILFTLFMVTGVTHAVNIIDGFNGLASMCVMIMMMALAYVAYQVGDQLVLTSALICAGAILGFFFWNFPAGLIFLGDGGAYFLGFTLAELSVLLIARNPDVSPFFPVLMCAYPLMETAFTMYRRKILKGVGTASADGIHLHTLIYRRVVRWRGGVKGERRRHDRRQTTRNSMTAPYLWALCLCSVIPALLWWNNTPMLLLSLTLFFFGYVVLYWRIVRFRVPRWLIIKY